MSSNKKSQQESRSRPRRSQSVGGTKPNGTPRSSYTVALGKGNEAIDVVWGWLEDSRAVTVPHVEAAKAQQEENTLLTSDLPEILTSPKDEIDEIGDFETFWSTSKVLENGERYFTYGSASQPSRYNDPFTEGELFKRHAPNYNNNKGQKFRLAFKTQCNT